MHVGRGHLARPAQPQLVVRGLSDGRDRAGDPDAVAAHRDDHLLAVLVEHLEVERLGVLAAELEDVADLDASGHLQHTAAAGTRIARPHVGGLDDPVGGEVAPSHQVDDVFARLVRPGHPPRAFDDTRVDDVAHAAVATEGRGTDVAADQPWVGREVGLSEGLHLGR